MLHPSIHLSLIKQVQRAIDEIRAFSLSEQEIEDKIEQEVVCPPFLERWKQGTFWRK